MMFPCLLCFFPRCKSWKPYHFISLMVPCCFQNVSTVRADTLVSHILCLPNSGQSYQRKSGVCHEHGQKQIHQKMQHVFSVPRRFRQAQFFDQKATQISVGVIETDFLLPHILSFLTLKAKLLLGQVPYQSQRVLGPVWQKLHPGFCETNALSACTSTVKNYYVLAPKSDEQLLVEHIVLQLNVNFKQCSTSSGL